MTGHTVKSFEAELEELTATLGRMGGLVEENFGQALDTIVGRDSTNAEAVIEFDQQIDAIEHEVEAAAVRILALRQPMARDLREVVSSMKIAADLERIGDLAKNMGKRAFVVNEHPPVPVLGSLKRMGEQVLRQLDSVLTALAERSAEQALAVWHADEEVDAHYNSIFRELLTYMIEDPRTISTMTHFLFIAKNLERAGDHATNIAETIHFMASGEYITQERPKQDLTSTTPLDNL